MSRSATARPPRCPIRQAPSATSSARTRCSSCRTSRAATPRCCACCGRAASSLLRLPPAQEEIGERARTARLRPGPVERRLLARPATRTRSTAAGFEILRAADLERHIRQTYQVLGRTASERAGDRRRTPPRGTGCWRSPSRACRSKIAIDRGEFGWGMFVARKPGRAAQRLPAEIKRRSRTSSPSAQGSCRPAGYSPTRAPPMDSYVPVEYDVTITDSLTSSRRKPRYPARNMLKVTDLSKEPGAATGTRSRGCRTTLRHRAVTCGGRLTHRFGTVAGPRSAAHHRLGPGAARPVGGPRDVRSRSSTTGWSCG